MIGQLRWILDACRIAFAFVVLPPLAYAFYTLALVSADCSFAPVGSFWAFLLSVDFCYEPAFALFAFQPFLIFFVLLYAYLMAFFAWLPLLLLLKRKQWLSLWQIACVAGVFSCVILAVTSRNFNLLLYAGMFCTGMFSGAAFWLTAVWKNGILVKSKLKPAQQAIGEELRS
ncbi:MAG: hypothetical protein ACREO1_01610 [Arenimonas sp.]